MRRAARSVDVYLGQPARQLRHARDRCRSSGGERHLRAVGGCSVSFLGLSERGAGSKDNDKHRERNYAHRFGKKQL